MQLPYLLIITARPLSTSLFRLTRHPEINTNNNIWHSHHLTAMISLPSVLTYATYRQGIKNRASPSRFSGVQTSGRVCYWDALISESLSRHYVDKFQSLLFT
jgi:hypothetical protein